jgi:Zn-dependent protease with chaperone function
MPRVSTDLRVRLSQVLVIVLGGVLLIGGLWYVRLLAPIVDTDLVIGTTVAVLVFSTLGLRMYLATHPPLDPARPSSGPLTALVADLVAQTGVARPRLAIDDSQLARAVANVGAVEVGPRSETILFTEQLVADLEAGRFGLESLRGVVLHELGHLHLDHSYLKLWTGIGERLVRLAALLGLIGLVFSPAARSAAVDRPWLIVAIAIGPLVVASILAVVSRAHETQADDFAIHYAAGRQLLDFLGWMGTDLAPFLTLDQSGVPRDEEGQLRIRAGLQRLIADAEGVKDKERAEFFREALARFEERVEELRRDLPLQRRLVLVARRLGRMLGQAWLGLVPWNRSHPPLRQRMARIAAEIGASA